MNIYWWHETRLCGVRLPRETHKDQLFDDMAYMLVLKKFKQDKNCIISYYEKTTRYCPRDSIISDDSIQRNLSVLKKQMLATKWVRGFKCKKLCFQMYTIPTYDRSVHMENNLDGLRIWLQIMFRKWNHFLNVKCGYYAIIFQKKKLVKYQLWLLCHHIGLLTIKHDPRRRTNTICN